MSARRKTRWTEYRVNSDYKTCFTRFKNHRYFNGNPWFTSKFSEVRKDKNGKVLWEKHFTWRQIARMVIDDQLNYLSVHHPDITWKEKKAFLDHFFPFGRKENTPYQSWLRERKDAIGTKEGEK